MTETTHTFRLPTFVGVASWGLANSSLMVPASADTSLGRDVFDNVSVFVEGFKKQHALSINSYHNVLRVPFVSVLFFYSSPPAVTWFVVPVRIDSVQSVPRWFLPHVVEECFKVTLPAIADGDSSSSIVVEVMVSLVEAPPLHRVPGTVLRGPMHSVLSSVNASLSAFLHPKALARVTALGPTRPKGTEEDINNVPTITYTSPIRGFGSTFLCDPPSESLTY